jgi:protocatechuate 3,4-dioxygenase beta subunit
VPAGGRRPLGAFSGGSYRAHTVLTAGRRTVPEMDDERHEHDLGLSHDLATLLDRRRALVLLGGAGLVALVGCGSDANGTNGSAGATSTTSTTSTTSSSGGTEVIPEETAGPFPADGSNGVNVLTESGIVRSDITSSFGSASGVAEGVPTTVELVITDAAAGGTPFTGAAVYLWHCDRDGAYSLYSDGVTNESYLRGVQEADADGRVAFTTIFPGCYSGRWPHMHFEVYASLADATAAATPVATSQLALPEDTCNTIYATDGYEQSVSNMSQISLQTDNVFSDGAERETPTASGSVADAISLALTVPV